MIKKASFLISCCLLCGCTASDSWKFNTDYFSIVVNDSGYINSMKTQRFRRSASLVYQTNHRR